MAGKIPALFLGVAIFFCAAQGYPGVFVDDLGRKVDIAPAPRRIVSLAPGITEILYALGLGREIAGVTLFCTYPEEARLKPTIGGFTNISVEKVLSLNPDLVIGTADGNRKEQVAQLEGLGVPVYITNPKTLEGILDAILAIGRITGRDKEAQGLARDVKHRVDTWTALVSGQKKRSVFFQIGFEPIITVGRDTLHNQLISLAGGVNIAGEERTLYPRYTVEEIVRRQPEVMILSPMKQGGNADRVWNQWKRWQNIPAVKHNRLAVIDTDLIDRSSPRIADGLGALVKAIHPEAMGNKQ